MIELIKDDFSLCFDQIKVYESDLLNHSPVNTSVTVRVAQSLYSAVAVFDANAEDLKLFFDNVVRLWNDLQVESYTFKEPYGKQFITIRFDGMYFVISGLLCDLNRSIFEIVFTESADQSYLISFISSIKNFDYRPFFI